MEALRGPVVEELRLAHGMEQKYCSGESPTPMLAGTAALQCLPDTCSYDVLGEYRALWGEREQVHV